MAAIALVAAFLVACGGDEGEEQPPTGALPGELEIFDLVISMTQRGPGFATDVPSLYIYSSDLVPARVDVTEMLGSETLLHLDIGRHGLLAKVDPGRAPGQARTSRSRWTSTACTFLTRNRKVR